MNTFAPHLLALLPNLAGPDMLIIFMIVLIMFGAKKLPELAKGLGQAVREFSKAKDDMHSELNRTTQVLEAAPTYADPNVHPPVHPPIAAPQPNVAPTVNQPVAHPVDHASVPNPAGQPVAPAVPVGAPAVAASAVPTTPHTPASS